MRKCLSFEHARAYTTQIQKKKKYLQSVDKTVGDILYKRDAFCSVAT